MLDFHDSEKENICKCEYDDCILVLRGDWVWITAILGLTGPKGLHFCKDCLCKLSDLSKGATHTPNPLSKYEDFVPQDIKFESRTFKQLKTDNLRCLESGKSRSKLKDFNNCDFPSLLAGTGPIILKVSCMPLQISLGLGLKILNLNEEEAVAIDCEIKRQNGEQTTDILEIMNKLKQQSFDIEDERNRLGFIDLELEVKTSNLGNLKKEHSAALRTNASGKSFREKTVEAKQIQEQYKEFVNELKDIEKEKKTHEKALRELTLQYEDLQEKFDATKCLFQTRFRNLMDKIKLQRQVYHSDALVENDADKLTKNKTISELPKRFTHATERLADGSEKEFSSFEQAMKMKTLFLKPNLNCATTYTHYRNRCADMKLFFFLSDVQAWGVCSKYNLSQPQSHPNFMFSPVICLRRHNYEEQ